MKIRQYEWVRKEIESKEINLPKETSYYFETGERRAIKIIPKFTTWNKNYDKEEELYELVVVCLYTSFECRAEKFTIRVSEIENIYYSDEDCEYKEFVVALVNDWFEVRTKEQFDADFKYTFNEMWRV